MSNRTKFTKMEKVSVLPDFNINKDRVYVTPDGSLHFRDAGNRRWISLKSNSVDRTGARNYIKQTMFGRSLALETLDPPVFNAVYTNNSLITGTGIPGAQVTVIFGNNSEVTVTVDENGEWAVSVPLTIILIEGTRLSAFHTLGNLTSENGYTTILGLLIAPATPEINPVYDTSTTLRGTGPSNSEILLTYLGNTITTDSNTIGRYFKEVPENWGLLAGQIIEVQAKRNGLFSGIRETVILETPEPDLEPILEGSTCTYREGTRHISFDGSIPGNQYMDGTHTIRHATIQNGVEGVYSDYEYINIDSYLRRDRYVEFSSDYAEGDTFTYRQKIYDGTGTLVAIYDTENILVEEMDDNPKVQVTNVHVMGENLYQLEGTHTYPYTDLGSRRLAVGSLNGQMSIQTELTGQTTWISETFYASGNTAYVVDYDHIKTCENGTFTIKTQLN